MKATQLIPVKSILTGFWIVLFSLTLSVNAQDLMINTSGQTRLEVDENTYLKFTASNALAGIRTSVVNTEQGEFTRLFIPEYVRNMDYGHPELPVLRKLIEIPLGASPRINVVSSEYVEFSLHEYGLPDKLYPCQPPRSKSQDEHDLVYDASAYQVDAYNTNPMVTVNILGIMRNIRLGRLNISPVQYNPVSHTLKVFKEITFEIVFEGADIEQTMELKHRFASPYFEGLHKRLINYQPLSNRENFMRYPVKYVIISARMFESQLQPLIEWKKLKGFTVIEAYTDQANVGPTTLSIRSYIDSLYNAGTADDPAPSFVLFVGDIQQMPTWENGNGETDRLYCEKTGDLLPDIYYGRFSAQTVEQLQPQIDKTLQYEKYTMPDPDYLNEVVMVAGMDGSHGYDWANGQINYGTINYFNEDHGITSHTYLYPESGSSSAAIIQDISNGVTYGNYTAHCSPQGWADPSFTIGDIATLENEDMYGLLVGNCCSSSEYAVNECFGEAIVRAVDKGAVGYIGGSNSTYWDEDYYWGVGVGTISQNPPPYEETGLGMYDRAFHDHGEEFGEWYVSQDEMVFAGNLAVMEGSPSSAEYYWDIYNVLGDPSLMIYFSEPPVMAVSYPELLPLGSTAFTVTTEPYAYVALSLDGELLAATLSDDNGIAELTMEPVYTAGIGDVVVTKQNGQPYFGTVVITNPTGPYLILNDNTINDSLGNNNGFADYGEMVYLNIALENLGGADALNTTATLIGSDPYITVSDDYQEFGTILSQSILWNNNAFAFEVQDVIPDQHAIDFELEIESVEKETWTQEFTITLNAPVLSILGITIDDSQFGDGNGRLDPGETADIKISNRNAGHCPSEVAIASLASYNAYLTFDNTTDTLGSLGLLGSKNAVFRVHVDPETPNGAILIDLEYDIIAGPYDASQVFTQRIGLLYEDWETGDFTKFEWVLDGDQPWEITHVFPYEGIYSAKSGLINDGETSELSLTLEVMVPDSITFIRKVSSESFDKLCFFIDNDMLADWSGTTTGWTRESFAVNPGWHTFKWVYQKNASGGIGQDCAWLDYITMPSIMTLTCYAGPDDDICKDETFQCSGEATDWVSVEWSTSGTGTFNTTSILDPLYTPSTADLEAGNVELTLVANNDEGSTVDDEMMLSFIEAPAAPGQPEGPTYIDVLLTPLSEYTIGSIDNATSYLWAVDPAEAGSISGTSTTGTVQWNTSYWGTAYISAKAFNQCGESDFSESIEVTVDNTVGIDESSEDLATIIYPNPFTDNLHLTYQISDTRYLICDLYSIVGVRIDRLLEEEQSAGIYDMDIDLSKLPEGIYLIRVQAGDELVIKKVVKIN